MTQYFVQQVLTSGDIVEGIKKEKNFFTETLVTHKSQNISKILQKNIN